MASAISGLRTIDSRSVEPVRPTGVPMLNQTDFLRLLTAQLKNQDPTQPVDNAQFVSQMAQFSTVSGIETLNRSVGDLATRLSASELGGATALIGGAGLVPATLVARNSDGGVTGAVELTAPAERVTLTVSDMAGRAVRTIDLGARSGGLAAFRWDGRGDRGQAVAGDRFLLSAAARTGSNTSAPATLVEGRITGVEPNAAGARLLVEGVGPVPLAELRRVAG